MRPFLWGVPVVVLIVLALCLGAARRVPLTDRVVLGSADEARSLGRGDGMTTKVIYPLALWRYRDVGPTYPDTEHPPLYSVYLALVTAFSSGDTALRAAALGPLLLVLVALYGFGRRWFDCRTGALAVLLCGLSGPIIAEACSGRPTMLSALWVTLALCLCAQISSVSRLKDEAHAGMDRPSSETDPLLYVRRTALFRLSLLLGAVTGAALLTDYSLLILAPITAAYVLGADRSGRARNFSAYLVLLLLLTVPWMIRNAGVTGNPFFSLYGYRLSMYTSSFPGETFLSEVPQPNQSAAQLLLVKPGALLGKLGTAVGTLFGGTGTLMGLLGGFVALGLVVGFADNREERLRRSFLATLGGLLVMGFLFVPTPRVLIPLMPVGIFLATRMLLRLVDAFVRRYVARARRVLVGSNDQDILIKHHLVAAAACGLVSLAGVIPALRPVGNPPRPSTNLLQLIGNLQQDTVIATDAPWDIAWRSDRRAIALPVNDVAFRRVNEIIQIDVIALTSEMLNVPADQRLRAWRDPAIIGRLPGKWVGFSLPAGEICFLRESLVPPEVRRGPAPAGTPRPSPPPGPPPSPPR